MAQADEIDVIKAPEIDATTMQAARLEVDRRATDSADAALLLAMLGLDGAPMRPANHAKNLPDIERPPTREHDGYDGARGAQWQDRAACKGRNAEDWFPVSENDSADAPCMICYSCPVRLQCADYAYRHRKGLWGIWAGFRVPKKFEALAAYLDGIEESPCDCSPTPGCVVHRQDLVPVDPVHEHLVVVAHRLDALTIGRIIDVHRHTIGRILRGETSGYVSRRVADRILSLTGAGSTASV